MSSMLQSLPFNRIFTPGWTPLEDEQYQISQLVDLGALTLLYFREATLRRSPLIK